MMNTMMNNNTVSADNDPFAICFEIVLDEEHAMKMEEKMLATEVTSIERNPPKQQSLDR